MELEQIIKKLAETYERLQYLQLQPTASNTAILGKSFAEIKECADTLKAMANKEPEIQNGNEI